MKKKTKVILICIPVLLLITGILCFIFRATLFLSPKEKVTLALLQTFGTDSIFSLLAEDFEYNNFSLSSQDDAGVWEDLSDMLSSTKGFSYETTLTLNDIEIPGNEDLRMLSGVGIQLEGEQNIEEKLLYQSFCLRYTAFPVLTGKLSLDNENLSLALPDLYEGYVRINTETFGTDYNASSLCSVLNLPIPEEYVPLFEVNLFDRTNLDFPPYFVLMTENHPYREDYLELLQTLYQAVEVEATRETKTFTINQEEISGYCYLVTLNEDDLVDFMEDRVNLYRNILLDRLSSNEGLFFLYKEKYMLYDMETPEEVANFIYPECTEEGWEALGIDDWELEVYLDRNYRLLSLEADSLPYYEFSIEDVNILFAGENYWWENISANFDIVAMGEVYYSVSLLNESLSGEEERTDTLSFVLSSPIFSSEDIPLYENTLSANYVYEENHLSLNGSFIERNSKISTYGADFYFDFNEDTLEFSVEADDFFVQFPEHATVNYIELSGDFCIAPTEEVTALTGTEYEILSMNETQLFSLALEIADNLEDNPMIELLKQYGYIP